MAYERDNVKTVLQNHIGLVRFMKVEGTERLMKCTLKPDLLPPKETDRLQQAGFDPQKPVNEKILSVWDLEKEGWRSFRIDSIMSIQVV